MRVLRVFLVPVLALVLPLASGAARAAGTDCPQFFARGNAPDLLNPKLAVDAVPLCFQAFAVLHSGATRTPLYSAERLTREGVAAARQIPRQGEFHPEARLPPDKRAELNDYRRSGFDRGHMAPAGDMPDPAAQEESFSLANMVPQAPKLNRVLWEGIESAVRTYATQAGRLYVVTGPAFRGAQLSTVGDVLVPTHTWKAVLDPRRGTAAAYVATNDDSGQWVTMSMAQLADFTGIEVFPGLAPASRNAAMRLPTPTPHYSGRQGGGRP